MHFMDKDTEAQVDWAIYLQTYHQLMVELGTESISPACWFSTISI